MFDTGVTRALARTLDSPPNAGTSAYGDLFEQMVLCEVQALRSYHRPDWELCYLQSEAGAEIDLVIDTGSGAPLLVEVKSTDDIGKLSLSSELRLLTDTPASRRLILSRDPISKKLEGGIEALPWRRGLEEIFGSPA
jgi:predicted AAA+ superfamily ATPase